MLGLNQSHASYRLNPDLLPALACQSTSLGANLLASLRAGPALALRFTQWRLTAAANVVLGHFVAALALLNTESGVVHIRVNGVEVKWVDARSVLADVFHMELLGRFTVQLNPDGPTGVACPGVACRSPGGVPNRTVALMFVHMPVPVPAVVI